MAIKVTLHSGVYGSPSFGLEKIGDDENDGVLMGLLVEKLFDLELVSLVKQSQGCVGDCIEAGQFDVPTDKPKSMFTDEERARLHEMAVEGFRRLDARKEAVDGP